MTLTILSFSRSYFAIKQSQIHNESSPWPLRDHLTADHMVYTYGSQKECFQEAGEVAPYWSTHPVCAKPWLQTPESLTKGVSEKEREAREGVPDACRWLVAYKFSLLSLSQSTCEMRHEIFILNMLLWWFCYYFWFGNRCFKRIEYLQFHF